MRIKGRKITISDVVLGYMSAAVIVWLAPLIVHTIYTDGIRNNNFVLLIVGVIMLGIAVFMLWLILAVGLAVQDSSAMYYQEEESGSWVRHSRTHLFTDTSDNRVRSATMGNGAYHQGMSQISLLAPAEYTSPEVGSTFDSGPAFDSSGHSSMFND